MQRSTSIPVTPLFAVFDKMISTFPPGLRFENLWNLRNKEMMPVYPQAKVDFHRLSTMDVDG